MAISLFPLRTVYQKRPINASALGQLVDFLTRELGVVERAVRDAPLVATRSAQSDVALSLSDGLLIANATADDIVVTLPPLPEAGGCVFRVKRVDSSGNTVTVESVHEIDGSASLPIAAGEGVTIIGDATTYYVVGRT